MKTVDVSRRVMDKVVGFERKRVSLWLRGFIVVITALVIGLGSVFIIVVRDLLEKQAFDFIELFTQDREVVAEFWREVLVTFWDELPTELITIAALILAVFLIVMIITRKRRVIMQKKLQQLEKYR